VRLKSTGVRRHESDTIYNNVVLHATLIADHETGRLKREDGSLLPEIVLLPRLDTPLRRLSWDHSVSTHRKFPCENHWATAPPEVVDPFLIDLARSRMRNKALRMAGRFVEVPDFDQIAFEEACRALGFMPNAEPMVLLARRVPLSIAVRLESAFDFMCLLLGTSGLLPGVSEFVTGDRSAIAYALRVRERYIELNQGLNLTPMPRQTWRFSRMRPGNFPALRIAQIAALFGKGGPLAANPFMSVANGVELDDPVRALNRLLTAEPDTFWRHHASLTKCRDRSRSAVIGAERRTAVVVNAFLPLSCFASEYQNRPELNAAAMLCLDLLPPYTDTVTRPYSKLRGRPTSATITQGIHELSRSWCTEARCLECPIGRHLSRAGCRLAG